MVRVGFIVEGDSEKVMIESPRFRRWAGEQGLEICHPVVNAKGGGNLLPHHLESMVAQLSRSRPQHVVVLTDLETAPDVDAVKKRCSGRGIDLVFVAVKALEAWFLADTEAMRKWLNAPDFIEPAPEQTPAMPWDWLKDLAKVHGARGTGPSKVLFARRFCQAYDFQLPRAAMHPACPSAREFHDVLQTLGRAGESSGAGETGA